MLINPYDENALKNALGFLTPPLNLMYLASSLEKDSYSVKIVDDDFLQIGYQDVSEMAEKLNPQMIGVTATTSTINSGLKYLETIKRILSQCFNSNRRSACYLYALRNPEGF